MLEIAQVDLKPALEVARITFAQQAPNGIRYGSFGETLVSETDLEHLVQAVPQTIATALVQKTYYFVPLTISESPQGESDETSFEGGADKIMIAPEFSNELSDVAVCHRNANFGGMECIFISTRLMQDRFALAFEFYINAGHHFVEAVGVPESFMNLIWMQAKSGVRGETSQDAWEYRMKACGQTNSNQPESNRTGGRQSKIRQTKTAQTNLRDNPLQQPVSDEKARSDYYNVAFADIIAIYLLSLTVDFDYLELREREYPLLAAPALAERLRHVAQLFPPNADYEFSVRYRQRDRIGA